MIGPAVPGMARLEQGGGRSDGGTSHAPTIGSLVLETEDPGSGMDVSDRISDIEDMTVWNTSTVA